MIYEVIMCLLGDLATRSPTAGRLVDFHIRPLGYSEPGSRKVQVYGGFGIFSFNLAQLIAQIPFTSVKIVDDQRYVQTRATCGRLIHLNIETIPTGTLFGSCGIVAVATTTGAVAQKLRYPTGLEVRDLLAWRYCVNGPAHRPISLSVPITVDFGSLRASQPLDRPCLPIAISFETSSRKSNRPLRVTDFAVDLRVRAKFELTEFTPNSRVVEFKPSVSDLAEETRISGQQEGEKIAYSNGLPYVLYQQTTLNSLTI